MIIEEHEKKTNLTEVQQVLHELLVAWKNKQVETIAAQIKFLRYKRDAKELCKLILTSKIETDN